MEEFQRLGVQPQEKVDSNAELQRAMTTIKAYVYNCYLDACVQCNDIDASLELFEEMKHLSFVDVVSYNTLLKGYLASNRMADARALVQEMSSRGFSANKVTYNELLNAKVASRDRVGMWRIVDEMLSAGLKANLITCSILLKSLTPHSSEKDLARVLDLIKNLEDCS
eukprot:g30313.t1